MIALQERRFRDRQGKVLRPFSTRAAVRTRGCSGPLQAVITDFGADVPFAQVSDKLQRHYGIPLSYHAARSVTLRHAHAIDPLTRTGQPAAAELLIAEMDGSMVPCVRVSEAGPDRRRTRQTEWHELKLGLVRQSAHACASVAVTAGNPESAGALWQALAQREGLRPQTRLHGVGDGALWLADQMALQFGRQGTYLVDFYHVCEYLAAAAPSCAPAGNHTAWLEQQRERLKRNEVRAVLDALQPGLEAETATPQPKPGSIYKTDASNWITKGRSPKGCRLVRGRWRARIATWCSSGSSAPEPGGDWSMRQPWPICGRPARMAHGSLIGALQPK